MILPTTLLLTYQAEYETTPDLTIAMLCDKYSVETKQLKGYTKWKKRESEVDIIATTDIIATPALATDIIVKDKADLLNDIDEFKQMAVKHAIEFMHNDIGFAEVKEFKDMVAIVDSIEKSYVVKDDTGPTINILIQNLAEKFKDDC